MTDAKHITRSAMRAASNVDWDSRFRAISRNPATADFGADSAAYSVVKDTAKVGATVVTVGGGRHQVAPLRLSCIFTAACATKSACLTMASGVESDVAEPSKASLK